jgi:hypothetical protein
MGFTRALVLAALLAAAPAHAEDPSDTRLVLTGLALAPPTYLVGVSLHEGSHALAAKLVGGSVDLIHLFPPGVDPRAHTLRFGWVFARGVDTKPKRIFFLLAPKITDAVFLSTYAALYFTDVLPDNKYALLALTVWATGFWVDFAKDVVLFDRRNDVVKAFHAWCMVGAKQIAPRLLYAGLSLGFSYAIIRGYERTFADSPTSTTMMPIFTSSF